MGSELAERLSGHCPRLKVIYTSGYSPGMAGKDASLLDGRNFLPKPYSIGKLAQFVRECLDAPVEPGELTKLEVKTNNQAQQINRQVSGWHLESNTQEGKVAQSSQANGNTEAAFLETLQSSPRLEPVCNGV
jgi:DNA-binding NtrC family response regulator